MRMNLHRIMDSQMFWKMLCCVEKHSRIASAVLRHTVVRLKPGILFVRKVEEGNFFIADTWLP